MTHTSILRVSSKILVLLVVLSVITMMGCSKKESSPIMSDDVYTEIEFEVVKVISINNDEVLNWIEENYQRKGVYTFDVNPTFSSSLTYILISEGEKPTGGYTITVDSLKGFEEEVKVVMNLRVPQKGEIVTQSLTYPHIVLQIKQDGRKIVLEN